MIDRRDDENFIPWEQIRHLLEPGMTTKEFSARVLEHLGLPTSKYYLDPLEIVDGSIRLARGFYIRRTAL